MCSGFGTCRVRTYCEVLERDWSDMLRQVRLIHRNGHPQQGCGVFARLNYPIL